MSRPMKDSGIAWVGQIPSDWNIHRVKYHFQHDKHIVGIHSFEYERLALTMQGVIKRSKKDNEGLQPEDFSSYQILRQNELVFKLIDLQNISTSRVGFSPYEGLVSPAYIVLHANSESHPKYAYYFFLFMWLDAIFNSLGDVGVRSSLNAGDLLNLSLIVPSLPEQQRIAEYLDKKCAEIDTLSNSIQQQIDTLEQYKRAVITETVTKGLHPSVPLKDSGIAWLGQIPSVWDIHPLYYYFSERTHPNRFGKENNLLSLSYGKIIKKDINTCEGLLPASYNSYNIIDPMDIVLRLTDLQNDKRSLRTGLSHDRGIITSAYVTLKPARQVYSAFFHYLLHAYDVKKVLYNMGNGVRQSLNYAELSKLPLIEPSLKEQQAIANYLDEKCSKIDAIIQDKQQQLKKLEQYKKATIFEYVTGKKQVPEA